MDRLLDISAFPFVRFHAGSVRTKRDFDRFVEEWQELRGTGKRYVTIAIGSHPEDEAPEIERARGLFFKSHGKELAQLCLGLMIVVEPDDERRQLMAIAAKASVAFGLRLEYFATEEEAWLRARALLTATTPEPSPMV